MGLTVPNFTEVVLRAWASVVALAVACSVDGVRLAVGQGDRLRAVIQADGGIAADGESGEHYEPQMHAA